MRIKCALVRLLPVLFFGAILASCGSHEDTQNLNDLSSTLTEDQLTFSIQEVATPQNILAEIKDAQESLKEKTQATAETSIGDITQGIEEGLVLIDKIINTGKQIWDIIDKGRPVVDINHDYATAIPDGITHFSQLDCFSDFRAQSFEVIAKNIYGIHVVSATFTLVHQYNGSYNEKGKYLTNVSIIPSNVKVVWGFSYNVLVKALNPANVGTKDKPVASLSLELQQTIKSPIMQINNNDLFQFRGDRGFAYQVN